jgi:tetratricopeptide (TPR) repeat protein
MFRTAIMVVANGEMRSVDRLVEEAVGCGMLLAVAEVIVAISQLPNIHGQTLRNFRSIANKWADTCADYLAEGRLADAFALATACRAVLPTNRAARNIERDVLLRLRDRIRTAQTQGDHTAVVAMGDVAGRMLYRRHEIAASYAKSLLAVGRGQDALVIAREASAAFPDNIDLLALTAHIAATEGELATALELYGQLGQSSDPGVERYRHRLVRFLDKAERIGPRQVRTLVAAGDYEEAIALCELIAAHTGAKERITVELLKLRRSLRIRLRELDDEEDTAGEPMRILKLMLRIVPDEASTLRRLALESMKLQDFEGAVGYWRALDRVSPGIDNTAYNINRCEVLAQRKASRGGGSRTALAA